MLSRGELRVYKTLYLNKKGLHVRDASKHANLTLPAVVKHINRGKDRGTILCETKGRMKICSLNFKSRELLPLLQEVELARFNELPASIRDAFNSFTDDLQEKPLIALIFGSYARKEHVKTSDLDVLLVFQHIDSKIMKRIEYSASKIKGRTNVNIQPVSLDYDEFQKEMTDLDNELMKDVREFGLVMYGIGLYTDIIGRFYP